MTTPGGKPDPKKPGTSRFKGKGLPVRSRSLAVSTSEGTQAEDSQIRRRVAAPVTATGGLSLRWKLVVAMSSVVGVTALAIFFAVYNSAVAKLDAEIDVKGQRLLSMLEAVDAEYWYAAIHPDKAAGPIGLAGTMEALLEGLGIKEGWKGRLEPLGLSAVYASLVDPLGGRRDEELKKFLDGVSEGSEWNAKLKEDGSLRNLYDQIVKPRTGSFTPKPFKDMISQHDLYDARVLDVGEGYRGARSVGIRPTTQGGLEIKQRDHDGGLHTTAATIEMGGQEVDTRIFVRYPKPDAPHKLICYVALTLSEIEDAKSQLRTSIFLPIFITGFLGLGVAFWISTIFTTPLRTLMQDITIVSGGNLDHQTRASSRDEIGQLAVTFGRMTQALKTAHEQELEQRALQHELNIATEIQSNLLPKKVLKIPGYDVGAFYRPSMEVGGDYYDFIEIDDQHVGLIVADVSGKGVPGSLVMSMARAFFRMEAELAHNLSAGDTMIRVNRMLAPDIKKGMFVTAVYCILNTITREVSVASAGHNPMLRWCSSADTVELINPGGIALGFDRGAVFERTLREQSLILEPGDRLVMYTDGTIEAMDAQRQEFGDQRFYDLCRMQARCESNEFINVVVRALDGHRGNAPQHDDMTIVTLRVT